MAKDKERSINPAQLQRKAEKAKALKKSRAELQAKRNEKLARRNPDRIQREINDLKALEASGDIKPREKAILADLERDLKAVRKAKEAVGGRVAAQPSRPQDRLDRQQSSLGKRRHDGQRKYESSKELSGSDTDESVRNIPWPRDTPPPIPKEFRRNRNDESAASRSSQAPAPTETRTTYESAPLLRDLKKEAVGRFVPTAVRRKQDAIKGQAGQLLEPDELDTLERQGYLRTHHDRSDHDRSNHVHESAQPAHKFSQYKPRDSVELQRLRDEEEAFERELAMEDIADTKQPAVDGAVETDSASLKARRQVEIEEVADEDL